VNHFLERTSRRCGKQYELSKDARQALLAYDWPGNVRELENCVERCCAMNSGPVIGTADLPASILASIQGVSGKGSNGEPDGKIARISDLEKQAILAAIARLHGDKLLAAKLL